MSGPNEAKLQRAAQAHPGQVHAAADSWQSAAEGLDAVAEQIAQAKADIQAVWVGGKDAQAATAAFTGLGDNVKVTSHNMQDAATALNKAGDALKSANQAYADLPVPPPMPTPPTAEGGEISPEQEVHYIKLAGAHNAALSARETQAKAAYAEYVGAMTSAQDKLTTVAPPVPHDEGKDGPIGAGGGASAGGSAGGGGLTPGNNPSGNPIGPYSTSTGGTHVSVGHAEQVGHHQVLGFDPLGHSITGGGLLPGVDGPSADGVVGGVVGSTGTPALGLPGSGTLTPGTIGGGSTGSLAGGAAGGLAGVLGGAGGALGALRGSATSAGSAVAGRVGGVGGAVAGPLGGATGSTSAALGGTARAGALGAVGKSGVLGAAPTTGSSGPGGTSTAGAGATRTGATGRPGTMMPGSGGATGSGGSSSGAGGRASGGRYAAVADEEAAAGRGGRSSTGMRSGGRGGAMSAEGGTGRTGGAAGSGRDDKADKRKSMVFEDDDAWLDDDESGPDVIR
jgi:hypothetical protein